MLIDRQRSLAALGMAEARVLMARFVMRAVKRDEGGVYLPAIAVYAPAREELASTREEWALTQPGQRLGAILATMCFFFRAVQETHQAHEKLPPMPMASASEAIPPEQGFFRDARGAAKKAPSTALGMTEGLLGRG